MIDYGDKSQESLKVIKGRKVMKISNGNGSILDMCKSSVMKR